MEAMRLYAATGDGIARLDGVDGGWSVELQLEGSGAQCLAVDPTDPDTVYAGLLGGGVRRSLRILGLGTYVRSERLSWAPGAFVASYRRIEERELEAGTRNQPAGR
jgi:hypothetical protein